MGAEEWNNTRKSYMYITGDGPKDALVVLYQYRPALGGIHLHKFLESCEGYFQTDGYTAFCDRPPQPVIFRNIPGHGKFMR